METCTNGMSQDNTPKDNCQNQPKKLGKIERKERLARALKQNIKRRLEADLKKKQKIHKKP